MRTALVAVAIMTCVARVPVSAAEGHASRLPDLPDPPTDPILKQAAQERAKTGAKVINLTLTTGHAPKIARATNVLAQTIRNGVETPRLVIELAILRTAFVVGSAYELAAHKVLAKGCNYPQAKIDGVETWPKSADLFEPRENALLAYVDQMTHGGNVDDPTYDKFATFFPPREIVELTVTIGNYYGNGLLTKALRVKAEADGRVSSQGKC